MRERRKNLPLRRSVKSNKCQADACGSVYTDPCHVVPFNVCGRDEDFNLIPLCREHHSLQHAWGWRWFLTRYPRVAALLRELGWDWEFINGRFVMTHPQLKRR